MVTRQITGVISGRIAQPIDRLWFYQLGRETLHVFTVDRTNITIDSHIYTADGATL